MILGCLQQLNSILSVKSILHPSNQLVLFSLLPGCLHGFPCRTSFQARLVPGFPLPIKIQSHPNPQASSSLLAPVPAPCVHIYSPLLVCLTRGQQGRDDGKAKKDRVFIPVLVSGVVPDHNTQEQQQNHKFAPQFPFTSVSEAGIYMAWGPRLA